MDDELRPLSKLINKHHLVAARKLAARLAQTELGNSAHFWFQVSLLASLINNNQLREAAKKRMKQCSNYAPTEEVASRTIMEVDSRRDDGLDHLRHGRIEQATAAFSESLKLLGTVQPEDFNRIAMNQACLGMVMAPQEDYPAAVEAFRRAFGIWTDSGLWSPPALHTQPGHKHNRFRPGAAPKDVIFEELRADSNLQWVINSTFHFLRVLTAADNPLLQSYARACHIFVVRRDPSLARRAWAQLFYLWGAPAATLYTRLERLRYRG